MSQDKSEEINLLSPTDVALSEAERILQWAKNERLKAETRLAEAKLELEKARIKNQEPYDLLSLAINWSKNAISNINFFKAEPSIEAENLGPKYKLD